MKTIAIFAATVCLLTAADAQAVTPKPTPTPSPSHRFATAAVALKASFGPPAEYRAAPSASDPEIAHDLSEIRDTMAVFGTPAFPVNGITTFHTVCETLTALPQQYLLGGATAVPGLTGEPSVTSPELANLLNANGLAHQDEITLLGTSMVKCNALHMPWFAKFVDGVPVAKRPQGMIDGVHQMQAGYAQMMQGTAASTSAPQLSPANRDLDVAALATYTDAIAAIMTVTERQRLKAQIDAVAPRLATDYPAQYAAIARALARTDCSGLCAI